MFSREVEAVKFEMKQGELNRRIEAYKTALAAGEFARASWPHLAAWLDTTEEALSQVLRDGAGYAPGQAASQNCHLAPGADPLQRGVERPQQQQGGVSAPAGCGGRHPLFRPAGAGRRAGGNQSDLWRWG